MTAGAQARGALGVVISGRCRDIAEQGALRFPVFSRGTSTLVSYFLNNLYSLIYKPINTHRDNLHLPVRPQFKSPSQFSLSHLTAVSRPLPSIRAILSLQTKTASFVYPLMRLMKYYSLLRKDVQPMLFVCRIYRLVWGFKRALRNTEESKELTFGRSS